MPTESQKSRDERHGDFDADRYDIDPDAVDCSPALNRLAKALGKGRRARIRFQPGTYNFKSPVVFEGQPVKLIGVGSEGWEENNTIFGFAGDGLEFRKCNGAYMEGIRIYGSDKGTGLRISSIMRTLDVSVTHFDRGVEVWGQLEGGNKNDASRSLHTNLSVSVCRWYGIRVVGGDANQNKFDSLDVRDIGNYDGSPANPNDPDLLKRGIGLIDESFLGNDYYSPHFINCRGGAARVENVNSRVNLFGMYMEDGQPPAKVTKNTCVYGARNFATQIDGGFVQHGTTANELIVGNVMLQDGGIKLFNQGGSNWNLRSIADGVWQLDFANLDATRIYFIAPDKEFKGVKGPKILREWVSKPEIPRVIDIFP